MKFIIHIVKSGEKLSGVLLMTALFFVLICSYGVTQDAGIVYVNVEATGGNNGTSWEDAYTNLSDAVGNSDAGASIWVAKGIYYEHLALKDNQELYGGFEGSETELSQRDFRKNITAINGSDSGRVIRAAANNVIDGFTIINGYSDAEYAGAGIYAERSIQIRNNVIDNNHGGGWGGAIFIKTTESYAITNNVFLRNACTFWGASVLLYQATNGIIENNIFTDNSSPGQDGNLFLYGCNPTVRKNVFCGNHDFARSAGLVYFGSHSTSSNNLFVGNQASNCAAIYIYGTIYGIIRNTTIANNSNANNSGVIDIRGSGEFDFHNTIIAFNKGYGMKEILRLPPTPNAILKCNIFYENSSGAYYDLDSKKVINTETALNSLNPPGTNAGNLIRNPGFLGGSGGSWSAEPVFNELYRQTSLTDSSANWIDDELVGKFLNPNTEQPLQFYIVENTIDTITVWGDLSTRTSAGAHYKLFDYHLAMDSPAVGKADTSLAPDDDFDGDPRPGANATSDIGYDEAPDSFTNFPPYCQVITPQGEQSNVVLIDYILFDHESNNVNILVESSTNGGLTFEPAVGATGGDGTTQLASSPTGVSHTFAWNSRAQGLMGYNENVRIRITPSDSKTGTPGESWDFVVNNPPPLRIKTFPFTDDEDGWTTVTFPDFFVPPTFGWDDGSLFITSTDHTNTFGFWQSPLEGIPLEKSYIYRARFTLSTNVTRQSRVPLIRLRTNSAHSQKCDVLAITSNLGGEYSPTADPRSYGLYFTPAHIKLSGEESNDAANVILFFDLANFDESDDPIGTVWLHSVEVDRINPADLVYASTMASWDFEETGSTGWTWNTIPAYFTPPISGDSNGALSITGVDNHTFGFWSTDYDQLTVKSNVLYRGTFTISTDVTDQSHVPGFRIRLNPITYQSTGGLEIYSLGDGENSPTPEGSTYYLYYIPPQYLEGTDLDALILSFDMKSFDDTDDVKGTLRLENVTIDLFDIPE